MTSPALAAVSTLAVMVALAVLLLVYKSVNSWRRRFEAVSRASYIAVFGELTARGSYPQEILSAWTMDSVFRDALVDFMRLLDGIERDRLLRVARDLGIVDAAVVALNKSRRKKVRIRAALMLYELADPNTVGPLMHALNDQDSRVRVNASAALARIGEPDLVGAILSSVDRENEWDAARTMDHLVSLGAAAVDGLITYLGDLTERMPKYCRLALQSLGEIGDFKAEPTLLHALQSAEPEIRLVAAGALQSAGTQRCVEPLIAAMTDHDGRVRARSAKSLGAHFDDRAVQPLYEGLHDREWWVRKNSAASLVRLPSGVAALQKALRAHDLFARDAAREQLMLLGIPAGASAPSRADGPDGSANWIEDQLQALDTGAAADDPEDGAAWIEDQLRALDTGAAADDPEDGPDWIEDQLQALDAGGVTTGPGKPAVQDRDAAVIDRPVEPAAPVAPGEGRDAVPVTGSSEVPSDEVGAPAGAGAELFAGEGAAAEAVDLETVPDRPGQAAQPEARPGRTHQLPAAADQLEETHEAEEVRVELLGETPVAVTKHKPSVLDMVLESHGFGDGQIRKDRRAS